MRRNNQPYLIKKLLVAINRFYVQRFLRPHFDKLGKAPHVFSPQHIVVFGKDICIGDYPHIISASDNKIRLTTWPGKHISGSIHIGDYCLISPGVRISSAEGISIGDNVMIAASCYISDSDWHGIYNRTRPFRCTRPVTLENNVWLGERVIVCKGVRIGENSVIGAGSVVTKDIPANVIAAGNPARVIKAINPKRRMLKRDSLFRDADHYHRNLDELDKYTLAGNTWLGWLRSVFKPNRED